MTRQTSSLQRLIVGAVLTSGLFLLSSLTYFMTFERRPVGGPAVPYQVHSLRGEVSAPAAAAARTGGLSSDGTFNIRALPMTEQAAEVDEVQPTGGHDGVQLRGDPASSREKPATIDAKAPIRRPKKNLVKQPPPVRDVSAPTTDLDKDGAGLLQRLWGRSPGSTGGLHGLHEGSVIHLTAEHRHQELFTHDDYQRALAVDASRMEGWKTSLAAGKVDAGGHLLEELRGNATAEWRGRVKRDMVDEGMTKKLWGIIERALPESREMAFTFVEWAGADSAESGGGIFTSFHVARRYAQSTVVSVRANTTSLEVASSLRTNAGLHNLLLSGGANRPSLNTALLAELKQALTEPCSYQIIWDLQTTIYTDDMLPHELEASLGEAISLCKVSLLKSRLPDLQYWDYWPSTKAMVQAAAEAAGLDVEIDTLESKHSYNSWKYGSYSGYGTGDSESEQLQLLRIEVKYKAKEDQESKSESSAGTSASAAASTSTSILSDVGSWGGLSGSTSYPDITTGLSSKTTKNASVAPVSDSFGSTRLKLRFLTALTLARPDTVYLASEVLRLVTCSSSSYNAVGVDDLVFQAGKLALDDTQETVASASTNPAVTASPDIMERGLPSVSLLSDSVQGAELPDFSEIAGQHHGAASEASSLLEVASALSSDTSMQPVEEEVDARRHVDSPKQNSTADLVGGEADQQAASVTESNAEEEVGGFATSTVLEIEEDESASAVAEARTLRRRLQARAPVRDARIPSDLLRVPGSCEAKGEGGWQYGFPWLAGWWSSQEAHQNMAKQQSRPLRAWLELVVPELDVAPDDPMLVLGGGLGLLSIKLAKRYPHALVVFATPDETHIGAHVELTSLLNVNNSLVAVTEMTPTILSALHAPGEAPLRYIFVSSETMISLLLQARTDDESSCDLERFEALLAGVLSLGRTSFLELPSMRAWLTLVDLLLPACSSAFRSRYIETNGFMGKGVPELQIIEGVLPSADVKILSQRFAPMCDGGSRDGKGAYSLLLRIDTAQHKTHVPRPGVSVYFLLHLGLVDVHRGRLARTFMRTLSWESTSAGMVVLPWDLRVLPRPRGLVMELQSGDDGSMLIEAHEEPDLAAEAKDADAIWSVLKRELTERGPVSANGAFSFLELGSGHGVLSLHLASEFPNATIISLEQSEGMTACHYQRLEQHELWNNIVCNSSIGLTTIKNLYESPELLRYVMMRGAVTDVLAGSDNEDHAGRMLGMLVSSGLTSFLRVTTAVHASLALAIFCPWSHLPDQLISASTTPSLKGPAFSSDHNVNVARFAASEHPWPGLRGFPLAVLRRAIRLPSGQSHTRVVARRLAAPDGSPFSMVRLDVVNMTRLVHHHFDYKKDGHKRTYTMHVETDAGATERALQALQVDRLSEAISVSETSPLQLTDKVGVKTVELDAGQHVTADRVVSVHLHRDHDDHLVPYVAIQAITLVAAMRLGMVPALLDRAYGRFLALPLWEDMAPWNIALSSSTLGYIDYDTRDITYDQFVPKVYQVLSVLMNYKRTVEDFGRCKREKARTPYGFSHVSDCVDPGTVLKGPCDDPAYPVPCADRQCHSDYISCLRAMYAIEQEGRLHEGLESVVDTNELRGDDRRDMEFGFDQEGVKKHHV